MSILVKSLSKKYARKADYALQDINFEFEHGIIGLLGPNGAGKTTLIKILAALIKPTSGTALVNGFDPVKNANEVRNCIGIVPQEYTLYPNFSAREFLEYMALLSRTNYSTKRIMEVLSGVGLDKHAHQRIRTFSGGMKQRLVIAQALVHNPSVLLIDEPTAGLDPAERVRFRNLFCEIALERTVLLSTHIVEDITATTNQVMLLDHGHLVFNGKIPDLVATAKGRIWEAKVAINDWNGFKERNRILNFRQNPTEGQIEVRFSTLDDQEPKGAEPVAPNIEDAYLLKISR
jgi:ABC-2 type transport system ATP-binding protein